MNVFDCRYQLLKIWRITNSTAVCHTVVPRQFYLLLLYKYVVNLKVCRYFKHKYAFNVIRFKKKQTVALQTAVQVFCFECMQTVCLVSTCTRCNVHDNGML